jgi:type II secretion system protein N
MMLVWMKRIAGYIAFAVLVAGICLWFGFPYTAYVNARLATMESSSVRVEVGQAEPLLPLGLAAQDIELACPTVPGVPTMELEELGCRVSPLSFVRKVWDASVQGRVFGGNLEGTGRLAPMQRPEKFDGRLSFEGVGLSGLLACVKTLENVSGRTTGEIVFNGPMSRIARGAGNATVTLDKVMFVIDDRRIPDKITVVDGQGMVEARLEKGRLDIITCNFSCKGMTGTISGKIMLRHPLVKSDLKLLVSITPDEFVKEQFPGVALIMRPGTTYTISLAGPLDNPHVELPG